MRVLEVIPVSNQLWQVTSGLHDLHDFYVGWMRGTLVYNNSLTLSLSLSLQSHLEESYCIRAYLHPFVLGSWPLKVIGLCSRIWCEIDFWRKPPCYIFIHYFWSLDEWEFEKLIENEETMLEAWATWLPVLKPMSGKNRRLVADEPVEFEKSPVEVQDFTRSIDHFDGIYRIYLKWMKAAKPENVLYVTGWIQNP